MGRATYMLAAVGLVAVAWWYVRDNGATPDDGDNVSFDPLESVAQAVDNITGGALKLSAMAQVTDDDVQDLNVQAFLRVVRRGEGTSDAGGYARLYGGGKFTSFADHPRQKVTAGRYTSTAAGAYQAKQSTWDETAKLMGLQDFSPWSQDKFAVGRIAARGALDDVRAGRFADAVAKCALEWASLPGSPYGQPTISMDTARDVYAGAGGVETGTA